MRIKKKKIKILKTFPLLSPFLFHGPTLLPILYLHLLSSAEDWELEAWSAVLTSQSSSTHSLLQQGIPPMMDSPP